MFGQTSSLARAAVQHVFPRTSLRLIHSYKFDEETEVSLLPVLVEPSRDAIDIGANVGRYTKPLSKLARHVHAFEPLPHLARLLKASLPSNVTVHQIALSDAEGVARLHVPVVGGRQDGGLAHLSMPATTEKCVSLEVPTAALDGLMMHDVGFVKIDVEGHEARVLEGATRLIEHCRPTVIVESEERHCPGSISRVQSYFESRGYVGFFVLEQRVRRIGDFTLAMQDSEVLIRASAGTARRLIPYVNNFVFLPRARMTGEFSARCDALLTQ